jgi:aerobic-type carbon monoxide dehydrogenase small subunit (CoxS/CutS family)
MTDQANDSTGFMEWTQVSEFNRFMSSPMTPAKTPIIPIVLEGRLGMSRRDFLKNVIAAGVLASAASYVLRTSPARAQTPGAAARLVTLNVNGQDRRVDVLPQETLAYTLRYKLGLTGTKFGCDRAECGACTVLLDDVPNYGCSTLTMMVRGRAVTTVEGLANPDTGALHPVQQAFIDELGPQCGFCTPGQVMSAVGLLRANPHPTVEEARHAMSGNLCRCGAYDHYLKGVMRAAGEA